MVMADMIISKKKMRVSIVTDKASEFIDFHAHILPGADHGSRNVETSMNQLASALDAGITTIIATPHFYPERHNIENFIMKREKCFNKLINNYSGTIKIIPAAEVLLCEGLNNLPYINHLCIKGTKTMLVEMPLYKWTARLIDTLFAIKEDKNIDIVLAHIDRYLYEDVNELMSMGFVGQINADSLISFWGRRKYIKLIEEGNIVALGSDVHENGKQYKNYKKAMSILKDNGTKLQLRMNGILQTNI